MAPNWFASFALIVWPLVAVGLYRSCSVEKATLWTILAGQLLLPVGTSFKLEMIPVFDKNSIPTLCALFGCMLATRRAVRLWNKIGIVEVLIFIYLFSPIVTSTLNVDPIYVGKSVIPGVGLYDGISATIGQFIFLVPLLIGRQLLRRSEDLQAVFFTLTVAGLAYSLLLLFEIRFSPQLHFWFYGYFPTDFVQEMRDGGSFRPMAFMGHGLVAAFFAMMSTVASAIIWRARIRQFRVPSSLVTFYLGAVLVLCKSGAALVYGTVLIPLVRFAKPGLQIKVALAFVLLALSYPVARMASLVPTNLIVNVAASVNEERAGSLKFRFDQEERLMERASERPMFGWGRYGRNRIYAESWDGFGSDASVTDGRWIITLGQFGLIGFLAEFGLLAVSVLFAARSLRMAESQRHAVLLAGLALLVSINIIELLPNSTLSPWTWLMVGTLLGSSEAILADASKRKRFPSPSRLLFAIEPRI